MDIFLSPGDSGAEQCVCVCVCVCTRVCACACMRVGNAGAVARLPLFMSPGRHCVITGRVRVERGALVRVHVKVDVRTQEEPHGVCTVAGKHCNPVTLRLRGLVVARGVREDRVVAA